MTDGFLFFLTNFSVRAIIIKQYSVSGGGMMGGLVALIYCIFIAVVFFIALYFVVKAAVKNAIIETRE